jgi:hypothetical protein
MQPSRLILNGARTSLLARLNLKHLDGLKTQRDVEEECLLVFPS